MSTRVTVARITGSIRVKCEGQCGRGDGFVRNKAGISKGDKEVRRDPSFITYAIRIINTLREDIKQICIIYKNSIH